MRRLTWTNPNEWSEWGGIRTWYKALIMLGVLIASIVVYALIHHSEPICSGPASGSPCGGSGGMPPRKTDVIARQVEAMRVPPFHVLRFRDVTCSLQGKALRVLCIGAMTKPNGDQYPKTSALFETPDKEGDTPVPICDQGKYGVNPKFNIFCAQ
jgi:hypothetical protein